MIRPARPDDYELYVRLSGELGVPDPPPGRERFEQGLVPVMSIVEGASGGGVGYVTWRRYGTLAHVVQLAVDPAMRGQRIGERLLEHVRELARAAGCTRWYLNVKRDNAPALKLYDRVGFRFELESVAMRLAWRVVPEVEVRERLAAADDDAAIAARFGIPLERLHTFRARGSVRLIVLQDDNEDGGDDDGVLGFAAFDPSFPGAATFCARTPELAVPLLAAIRHHADPGFDFVRVTVEGNRPLADAIVALGGEVTFELLRLSAAIDDH